LSLTDRPDLFVRKTASGKSFDREAWLRELFSVRINFIHRTEPYYYRPVRPPEDVQEPLIFGRIGRQITSDENASPDEDLEDVVRDAWKAASVIIDPRKYDEGQKLVLQSRKSVGVPFSRIPSFYTMAKVSVTTRDCCRISAYCSTRGRSLCSGMLGIRS
jgi:hypothetical protein